MPKKAKAVSGIRRRLKDWKAAVSALLVPIESTAEPLPPMSQRVALLKELVGSNPDWKVKVKAYFAEIDRAAAEANRERLGLQAVAEAPEAPAETQEPPVEARAAPDCPAAALWREVQRIERAQDGHSSITDSWLQGLNESPDRAAAAMVLADRLEAADRQFAGGAR